MSTSQLDSSGVFEPVSIQTRAAQFSVPAESLRVCKNGIEFRSHTPMEEWTELTLEVLSPRDGHREQTTGVVVACRGNSATGYAISVVLMGLTPQSAQLLQRAGFSPLA